MDIYVIKFVPNYEHTFNANGTEFPLDKQSLLYQSLRHTVILLAEKFTIKLVMYKNSYTFPYVRCLTAAGIIMSDFLDFYTTG